MIARIIVALMLLCTSRYALSFDTVEHERQSDNAFALALAVWMGSSRATEHRAVADLCDIDSGPVRLEGDARWLARFCLPPGSIRYVTYGEFTRLVDDLLYTERTFVSTEWYRRHGPENEEYLVRLHARGAGDVNPQLIERAEKLRERERGTFGSLALKGWDGIRATANNETHFQIELLRQWSTNRRLALDAAKEGNLYAALARQAIADHFLQDFFAPGHMLWPRENSHDVVSSAMHDGTNERGAEFKVNDTGWNSLAAAADRILMRSDHLGCEAIWIDHRRVTHSISTEKCRAHNEPLFSGLKRFAVDRGDVKLYGDGMLTRIPRQQLLMLLVQTCSILDVLYAWEGRKNPVCAAPDGEGDTGFYWSGIFGQGKLRIPITGFWFGQYAFDNDDDPWADSVSDAIIFSVGGQAPAKPLASSRYNVTLDYLPTRFATNKSLVRNAIVQKPVSGCNFFSLCNFGVAPSFQYTHDNDRFTALGAGLRFVKAFPESDIALSAYVHQQQFRLPARSRSEATFGVQVNMGFSLGSLYLGYGKNYFAVDDANLQATGMVSFGASGALSIARIKKWVLHNACYQPAERRN